MQHYIHLSATKKLSKREIGKYRNNPQFKKLFEMENAQLKFDDKALKAIARKAIKRKTGARALRSIVEEIMLDVMYEVPSRTDIKVCHITKELVEKRSTAELLQLPKAKQLKGEIA